MKEKLTWLSRKFYLRRDARARRLCGASLLAVLSQPTFSPNQHDMYLQTLEKYGFEAGETFPWVLPTNYRVSYNHKAFIWYDGPVRVTEAAKSLLHGFLDHMRRHPWSPQRCSWLFWRSRLDFRYLICVRRCVELEFTLYLLGVLKIFSSCPC